MTAETTAARLGAEVSRHHGTGSQVKTEAPAAAPVAEEEVPQATIVVDVDEVAAPTEETAAPTDEAAAPSAEAAALT